MSDKVLLMILSGMLGASIILNFYLIYLTIALIEM